MPAALPGTGWRAWLLLWERLSQKSKLWSLPSGGSGQLLPEDWRTRTKLRTIGLSIRDIYAFQDNASKPSPTFPLPLCQGSSCSKAGKAVGEAANKGILDYRVTNSLKQWLSSWADMALGSWQCLHSWLSQTWRYYWHLVARRQECC